MSEQLKLGELIELLGKLPDDSNLTYDFCRFIPGSVDSFRGYYEQLAIGWMEPYYKAMPVTAGGLLAELKEAVGKAFHGYKGGEYVMHADTRLWVANYGDSSDTAIVGVEGDDHNSVLLTGYCGV